MINKKLLTREYYVNKTSLFLQNSYGILDHYDMLIDVLQRLNETADTVISLCNITNDEVFLAIEELDETGQESDILDKIAHIYGLERTLSLTYLEEGTTITTTVTLNNFELWMTIKAKILQNNYDGTYIQMREYYDKMKLPVYSITYDSCIVEMFLDVSSGITVGSRVYRFADNPNIERLFKAAYLNIVSMGITYSYSTADIFSLGVWDSTSASRSWDNAKWGF